jgi:hypothetical protein
MKNLLLEVSATDLTTLALIALLLRRSFKTSWGKATAPVTAECARTCSTCDVVP